MRVLRSKFSNINPKKIQTGGARPVLDPPLVPESFDDSQLLVFVALVSFGNPRLIPWPHMYIKTWMYNNTWFVSLLYIMWCGHLVYRLEKLTPAKIELKNQTFMLNVFKKAFIYTMRSLYSSFDFDASNSPKLHCFEITHTKQCYTISIPGLMALYIWWPRLDAERIGRGMPSGTYSRQCSEVSACFVKIRQMCRLCKILSLVGRWHVHNEI